MNTFSAIVVVTFRAKLLGGSAIEEFEDSACLDCCRADTEEYEYILEAFSTLATRKQYRDISIISMVVLRGVCTRLQEECDGPFYEVSYSTASRSYSNVECREILCASSNKEAYDALMRRNTVSRIDKIVQVNYGHFIPLSNSQSYRNYLVHGSIPF